MSITNAKRPKFFFWLDTAKPEENYLVETCERLKRQRKFTKTVRDGIRLIEDLKHGRTEVLIELFPHIAMKLQSDANYALQLQLEDLKTLVRTQAFYTLPSQVVDNPTPAKYSKTLDIPNDFGMDELSLDVATTSNNSSNGQSLLDCLFNL
jgi:hypothetical protein